MNENYVHPDMPKGAEEGILRGMYLLQEYGRKKKGQPTVQLIGCGTILREVMEAATLLDNDFGIAADVWSATSFTELRREGIDAERWNSCTPTRNRGQVMSNSASGKRKGPVVAASDYVRLFADQIRGLVPGRYVHAWHGRLRPQRRTHAAAKVSSRWTGTT